MYVITEQTIALIVYKVGYVNTKIIVNGNSPNYSRYSATKILKHNCNGVGSTFDRRMNYSKNVLKTNSKLPILICHKKNIYMFPTVSSKKDNCTWFSYYHVIDFDGYDSGTRVYLADNSDIYVSISSHQFDLQMKRTSQVIAQYNSPHNTLL